jgi:hypothetical protein
LAASHREAASALVIEHEGARRRSRRRRLHRRVLPGDRRPLGHDDTWVTDDDEPQAIDPRPPLSPLLRRWAGQYATLPAESALRSRSSTTTARWFAAQRRGGHRDDARVTVDHPRRRSARRAPRRDIRRARRIEEASLLAAEDTTGAAKQAIHALEARLRAE